MPKVFERIDQIRALSPDEAARAFPVRLRAAVTYYDSNPSESNLFIHDATAGIYVQFEKSPGLSLEPGEEIEVTGVTAAGDFAPEVSKPQVRVLGRGTLPQPLKVLLDDLATGRLDSQWIESEGLVHAAVIENNHLNLTVSAGGNRVKVSVLHFPQVDRDRLVEAHVQFRGACASLFNNRRQLTGVLVYASSFDDIKIDQPGPGSLEQFPLQRAGSLLQFAPVNIRSQRVRVRGIVTFQQPGRALFIRDGGQGLIVHTHQSLRLEPGDEVEVVGFPSLGEYAPVLLDGVFQKLGRTQPPKPAHVTAEKLLLEGEYDADLVEVDAQLLNRTRNGTGELLTMNSGNRIFSALIEPAEPAVLGGLGESSVLRLRGICLVQGAGERNEPESFRLLVRSPEDITVLRRSAWLTRPRLAWSLGFLIMVVPAALAWVMLLRKRVQVQTSQLRAKNEELAAALAEAQQAKKQAQNTTENKSEFLARLSHEIRTPMNAILATTDLVLDSELTREQREYLIDAKKSAESLLALLNDTLDFSRIEAGRMELDAVPFSLHACLKDAAATLALVAEQKGLRLLTEAASDIPATVVGDPVRLRQVVLNLLNNAIKFTDRGSIEIRSTLYDQRNSFLTVHISVADTGAGIAPEKIERIFETFRHAGASATGHDGTGLGLSICSRLVDLMGGRIWVESQQGSGSIFHFTAVLQADMMKSTDGTEKSQETGDPAELSLFGNRRLKILLAEDNEVNQRITARQAAKQGHFVTVARNGREALATWEQQHFDLVLMDVQMPEMDGLECTAAIRLREQQTGGHTPIIALTAHAMKGDEEQCLEAGMDGYVSKPVRSDELFMAIARAINVQQPAL